MEEITEKIYCEKCGKELKINQKFCDNCGIENSNEKEFKTQLHNKKAIKRTHKVDLLIFFVIIVFLFFAFIDNSNNIQTQEKEVVSYDFESFTSEYNDLTDVQKNDFVQSNQGNLVQWSGYISNVYDDHIALKINKDDYMGNILCYYEESQKNMFKDLNKDEAVTIKGYFYDKSINWRVVNCELVSN